MALKEETQTKQAVESCQTAEPQSTAPQQAEKAPKGGGPRLSQRLRATKEQLLQALQPAIQWAKKQPQTAAFGEFLYSAGFWGEYSALRLGRKTKAGVKALGARIERVLRRIGGFFGRACLTGWREMTAPFVRFYVGNKNMWAYVAEQKRQHGVGCAAREGVAYFGRGIRLYFPLLRASFAYVLPVCALFLFAHTVQTVLGYNYILAVEVNGSVVGYVESEQVFDSAKAELAQRIKTVGDEERTWNISPAFTLDVSDDLMSETQMVDAILRNSTEEIQEATALYVNGGLMAVTTEGQELSAVLEGMKAPYEQPDNPDLRVEFTKDVELVDGVYFTDSISDYDSIAATLSGEEQAEIIYTVKKGDVPGTVASAYGMSVAQLQSLNPQQNFGEQFQIGDQLLITRAQPFLEVRRIETVVDDTVPIPYGSETRNSGELAFGVRKVTQQGVEGVAKVTTEYVYYGDSTVANEINEIERVTLQEPVTEIIEEGRKLPNGMLVEAAGSTWMWPVPNYKGVSRWMSNYHKGADIRANYGAPIVASNSGVVVTAGWHYSYGNYVIIDHGNGWRTLYAHASSLNVYSGQAVAQGDIIARIGSTGNSTGNHCHFEMYRNGVRVSARNIFPGR